MTSRTSKRRFSRTWRAHLLIAILAFGCNRAQVRRDEWLAMTLAEKRVVVESFIGHQKAAEAKGGTPWKASMEVDDYVREIEAIYRFSDDRTVAEIWEELAHRPAARTGDGPR